jgi:hypothetical protein
MARAHDPAKFLGVHVQQFTGRLALIAQYWQGRIERLETGQTQTGQHAAYGRDTAPDDGGDGAHRYPGAAHLFDALQKCGVDSTAGLVRSGGAVEQAIYPVLSEAAERFSGGTLADARSARCGESAITAMRSINNLRPSKVVLAFLSLFIRRVSSED